MTADAAEFEAAGLYDPEAPNADDRLALLEWLIEQGISIDQMTSAATLDGLAVAIGDAIIRPGPRLTLAEVAERAGVTIEEVEEMRRAVGFPAADRDERLFIERDADTFAAFKLAETVFGQDAILEFSRVMGSSLGRIADAAIWLFLGNVEAPLVTSEGSELALAKARVEATSMLAALPDVMDGIFRFHVYEAVRRSRQARVGVEGFDTARLALGFIDLVGFTSMSQQLDTRELGRVVHEFEGIAHDVVVAHDGRVVKLIGDEVMFVAVDPVDVCEISLTLVERYAADTGVTPRGGLAVGELLTRGGDYYGPIVNLASRITELAVPNELLATTDLRAEVTKTTDAFSFEPAGRRMLKGFDEPVELYSLTRPA